MSTKKPWFPLYAADFLTDTQAMSHEALGAYFRLLCYQWINGSVPRPPLQMSRIIGCTLDELDTLWIELEVKFEGDHVTVRNGRLERERKRADKISQGARRAGLASGQARKKDSGNSDKEHPFPNRSTDESTESNQSQSQSQLHLGEEGAAPRPTAKRKHRLPEDWQPSRKLLDWAKKEAPAVDIKAETAIFRDHFLGSGNPKIDWDRTWQVWMRKEQKSAHKVKRAFTRKDAERVAKQQNKIKFSHESWDAFIDRMQCIEEGRV